MKNIKLTLFILLAAFFAASCEKEDTQPTTEDTYISIPDRDFERILLWAEIDSDGDMNQKISREDALKVTDLVLDFRFYDFKIHDLSGIEGFANLTSLSVDDHALTEVDLSNNTKLEFLSMSDNQITTIDLSNNNSLKSVDLSSNQFGSQSSIVGLSNLQKLTNLELSFNELETITIDNELMAFLYVSSNKLKTVDVSKAKHLRRLYLGGNELTSIDVSANESLEILSVGNNDLSDINLEQNSRLFWLSVPKNAFTRLDVSYNPKMNYLAAYDNPELLCIKTSTEQEITDLWLYDNQMLSDDCM